jgi:hypothetical protein
MEKLNREAAVKRVKQMEEVWAYAKGKLQQAQQTQKRNADRHRREVNFEVGDDVWLSLKPYTTDRPSKKLDNQNGGKYRILEKVGNAYRLDLPPTMKIHPVFSPDKLRKAANDPLPGQEDDPADPIEINGEQEWEVEEFLTSRIHRGKLEYRVKWTGHDEDPQWYPARNFKGSPHELRTFHDRYPGQPGPPRRLPEWLRAWEGGDELPDVPDDDKAATPA